MAEDKKTKPRKGHEPLDPEIIKQLQNYREAKSFQTKDGKLKPMSIIDLAKKIGVPDSTLSDLLNRKNATRKSKQKIFDFLSKTTMIGGEEVVRGAELFKTSKEALERTEAIRYLLLALEFELRYFKDGSPEVRRILNKNLDAGDLGYISSLLTMLGNEERFQRWVKLSSNKFNSFARKGE